MNDWRPIILASALAAVLSAAPQLALAQPAAAPTAQDLKELTDYRLTMAVIDKVAKANKIAKQAMAKDPKQQRLAKQEAELATLDAKDELTDAEQARIAVLEDEITRGYEDDQDDGLNGIESISYFAQRIESNPPLAAAIRSVGLSSREYATALLALVQAALTQGLIEQKLLAKAPPEVSAHNLAFVTQHKAQLAAMGVLSTDDDN